MISYWRLSSKASFFTRYLSWDIRSAKRETLALSLYLPVIFTVYGLLLGNVVMVPIHGWRYSYCSVAIGTVYLQTSSGTLILSGFGVFSCASGLFMFPIIMSHLGKSLEVCSYGNWWQSWPHCINSSQIFALEYADGVGGLHDLVIQTFVRFSAKSCEAIIGSTTVLYLLVRTKYNSSRLFYILSLGYSVLII